MAGTPKKRERRERLQQLLNDEEAFDWLCARIASGDNLVAFCRELDIPYVAVNEWIQEDEERAKQYKAALEVRDVHNKEAVIDELMKIMTVDITQAFNDDGTLKFMKDIPEDVRRCIAAVEFFELPGQGDVRKIKKLRFWDKNKAQELMAKHLKMLTEKHEHTGADGGPMKVVAVRYPERSATAAEWAERQKRRQQLPPATETEAAGAETE